MMYTNPLNVDATEVLNKAIKNCAGYLGLSQHELSEIIGISRPQLSRLFNGTIHPISQNTKEWECALLFIRIIRSLEAILGEDPNQVREWLYHYNHDLSAKPIDKIKKITGLNEVVVYLDAMRG